MANSAFTKAQISTPVTHENGGLEADVSSYSGLVKISGGSTSQAVSDTDYQSVPSEGAFADGDKTKLDGIETGADVTDTTNVTAAGALMDSEVSSLSGIKTLTVPDSTTISTFAATVLDDTTAAAARTTLGIPAFTSAISFVIDGGGAAITTGVKGFIEVPFDCTIDQVTLLADQTGSIVVDIWKDTYANYPPTDADSITASAVPTISSGTKSQDATLTGWTTSISAGDILGFNVDSNTTCELVTLSLKVTRT